MKQYMHIFYLYTLGYTLLSMPYFLHGSLDSSIHSNGSDYKVGTGIDIEIPDTETDTSTTVSTKSQFDNSLHIQINTSHAKKLAKRNRSIEADTFIQKYRRSTIPLSPNLMNHHQSCNSNQTRSTTINNPENFSWCTPLIYCISWKTNKTK